MDIRCAWRLGIIQTVYGRGARVVEWDGLENRCGACLHRGFESHPLRLWGSLTSPSPNREGLFFYLFIVYIL
jgi:hypothetical protein